MEWNPQNNILTILKSNNTVEIREYGESTDIFRIISVIYSEIIKDFIIESTYKRIILISPLQILIFDYILGNQLFKLPLNSHVKTIIKNDFIYTGDINSMYVID
jgi:hypothetical protein